MEWERSVPKCLTRISRIHTKSGCGRSVACFDWSAAPAHGHERRVVIVLSRVQHAFSVRLADLGVSWRRLFHLWKEAGVLGADAWWSVDDRCVVFRRLCRVDVANVHRVDRSDLHALETRLLTAEEAIPAERVTLQDERLLKRERRSAGNESSGQTRIDNNGQESEKALTAEYAENAEGKEGKWVEPLMSANKR